jgi:type IV secretion system protein TrbL
MQTEAGTTQQIQRRLRLSILGGWVAVAALLLSVAASAQEVQPGMGMFDDIAAFYMQQAKAMQAVLEPYALRLFGLLSVISIGAFFVKQLLGDQSSISSLVLRFTLEIMKLGIFFFIVTNGPQFLLQLMGYFVQAGAAVTGQGELSPSAIVVLGFDACFRTFDAIGAMGWGDTAAFGLPLALAGMGILACFSIVGILYLVRVIELYLVMYGGVLLLGFGGISFTRDIPKNYMSYMLSAGAQLFMLNVVIGLGIQLVESWPSSLTLDTTPDAVLRQVLQLLVGSAVFAALAWSIPKVAASLVNGAVSLGAADAFAPAAAAGAAAAAGVAVASGGASNLAAATRGAVQATAGGVSLAKEQGASGVGAALKGLGHAAGATAEEAGRAAQAGMGLKPPSPHSIDTRGRPVENLGTRAANSLQTKAQQEREERAASGSHQQRPSEASGTGDGDSSTQTSSYGTSGFRDPQRPSTDRRLIPPRLPPDTPPPSSVSIRFETDD